FLSIFSTSTEIAYYNVAFILSSRTMILLPGALTGILLPAMSEVYGGGNKEELAKVHSNSTRYLAMLSFPLCLGGIAMAHQLLPLLYGQSYQPAVLLFGILLIGGAVGFIATSSSSLLYGTELQGIVVKAGILAALVNIVISRLTVVSWGAKGVALATAFAQALAGVSMMIYAYKIHMKQRFPGTNLLRIFSASLFMGLAVLVIVVSIKGAAGVVLALMVSLPLYIFNLFLTRSLTLEDMNLLEAAINRMPESCSRRIQPIRMRLTKWFYSG
ncbi:MAG: lipid II flippase MurJ, partial [Candidatus Zixiibacteriota bacterium]